MTEERPAVRIDHEVGMTDARPRLTELVRGAAYRGEITALYDGPRLMAFIVPPDYVIPAQKKD